MTKARKGKKAIVVLTTLAVLAGGAGAIGAVAPASAASVQTISGLLQGQLLSNLGDIRLPLRSLFEAMGADVSWNSDTKKVTIQKGAFSIIMTAGESVVMINGIPRTLDRPVLITDDKTPVPLRFVGDLLSALFQPNPGQPASCVNEPTFEQAMAELKSNFDERVADYLASLWDPVVGGFYFSKSARDHTGFLPDLESTGQIINFMRESGMLQSDAEFLTKLSAPVRQKLVTFTQTMQDPGDGYFYHPQWGKNIPDARRGRDLTWASDVILRKMNVSPLYLLPSQRSQTAAKPVQIAAAGPVQIAAAGPAYLQSEQALKDWMAALPWQANPYSAGNSVNAVARQIQAAGLGPAAVAYLSSIQNVETGLWGNGETYETVSAAMKVALMYQLANHPYPYAMKALESTIRVAQIDIPVSQITFIYNPWSAIAAIRKTYASVGLPVGFVETLAAAAPKMILKSSQKLQPLRLPDGSFKYSPGNSNNYSAGVLVSLGGNEGDVNATTIAFGSMLSSIYAAMGLNNVPIYDSSVMTRFANTVSNAAPIVKVQP
ncbi:copper amine oxidase N-terminal domain-containing protein [Paenibacillus hodogayensis]|uniref:Copper amine oxidase N-terminal domain-containing protein n=1 Tax=Paenibacillus hodogayensis TaxID=279208 RepID=A0ABV5VYG8_9BACL